MAKKIAGTLKLQIPAGKANPSPPVGPALGQRGLNIMEFCKAFNAKTQEIESGAPCPTIITYYVDKSFSMEVKICNSCSCLDKSRGRKWLSVSNALEGVSDRMLSSNMVMESLSNFRRQ